MGKHQRKVEKKLADRIASYESVRNTKGFTCPGSQNLKKQSGGGMGNKGRR